jgi:hypothetical protein
MLVITMALQAFVNMATPTQQFCHCFHTFGISGAILNGVLVWQGISCH